MNTLIIRHIPGSNPPRFQVEREDHKASAPVAVQPPFGFPVEGRPASDLMQELRWYLENFLEYPFSPETEHSERVLAALKSWGSRAFNDLFEHRDAATMLADATRKGYEHLCLQISSDDPAILQWPWESLRDPQATYLAVGCRIERRLNTVLDAPPISTELPTDRINILLVTARPYENDVGYRSISRRLVELIREKNIPAHVHVLRPPTFANLRDHLKEHSHFYHLIHFDGHGGFAENAATGSTSWAFAGKPEGVLVFENDKGERDEVSAEILSGLLREHAVPIMVLNACQSAMQSGRNDVLVPHRLRWVSTCDSCGWRTPPCANEDD